MILHVDMDTVDGKRLALWTWSLAVLLWTARLLAMVSGCR